ncbi:hypothetical protein BCR34DRAFT_375176 [Clohesyomyces aquaticus]|uniref:Uncharacterized protein n=1 Tax=Clohesyomyces aquaticus TaxID=1231657 RepID=A0A1Y1ZGD9_9PLEO|nr:hypothetical protein BCR34DRAFT_375176 [Clohesyomyces aquaticus]
MGNNQSTGHHNRLSKPKTNTNSPFGTPKTDSSPVSASFRYADLSTKDREHIRAQLTSPIETEFGSGLSSGEDCGLGALATHLQRRLSTLSRSDSKASKIESGRTSTPRLASLPNSKLSLATNTHTVDLETAIKILQEVRKNASPDDLAALQEALQPIAPSPSPDSALSLNRRASVINRSSSSLIRRRSLQATPGLATRGSPTDPSRKAWNSWQTPLVDHHVPKWKLEMMATSPLTQIAALDLADEGRSSPTPRAKTPGEMDYSHLGALQLGSLIVTNGAPSPASSAIKTPREKGNQSNPYGEDYFTALESPVKRKAPHQRAHMRSKSSVLPLTPPLHHGLGTSDQTAYRKSSAICESPLRIETMDHLAPASGPFKQRLKVVNKSADTLAQDYISELPDSPFVNQSHITSENHDEGYSDAPTSFREAALRILDGSILNDETPRPSLELSPTFKSSPPAKSSRGKDKRPIPLKKADSGYSSAGSFRVVQKAANSMQEGTVSTLPKKDIVVADSPKRGNFSNSDDSASLYTFEQMLALPISKKPLPPLPGSQRVEPKSIRSEFLDVSRPDAHSTFPISPTTIKSVASKFSIESNMSTNKRLQKRRPSVSDVPVVQSCEPITEGTIPDVPVDVRIKFRRRLSEAPGMEYLTHTYALKDDEQLSELSSQVCAPLDLAFPTPPASPEPRPRRHQRSQTERPPTPPPLGIRRSLSFFRRKSVSEKMDRKPESAQEVANPELNVVDFGTVAASLGRSPYDAAMPTLSKKRLLSPTHPHQLGNAMPRTKSLVSMDAKTAVEVARQRSKDLVQPRPEMPQRPRSYHDLNLDAGEGIAFRRRPRSVYAGIPAMPSIHVDGASQDNERSSDRDEGRVIDASNPGSSIRARSTGRGPVVSSLVVRYDQYGQRQKAPQASEQDWESHARLWSQRRKSIGEGLRQRASESQLNPPARDERASSQPPEASVYDRYSGGLQYGYERGYGIGGSAGTRQLHSAASRKSMHFSNQFGVDLSDVPVFLQRV